jgi:hypothetical protein
MKFKCIKDFWMLNESEERGNIPAFKAGDVYDFYVGKESAYVPELYTPKNNQQSCHYMYKSVVDEHFIQVEE